MVAHWKHIDESQRETISRMLSHDNRLKEIAKALGMHPTALSREIRRNRSKAKPEDGECPIDAQRFALARKPQSSIDINNSIAYFIAMDVAFPHRRLQALACIYRVFQRSVEIRYAVLLLIFGKTNLTGALSFSVGCRPLGV